MTSCRRLAYQAHIIAEAYIKGIKNFDIETAYKGIINNSNNEGPLSSVGRKGVQFYNKLGYIPYDVNVNENVARTLEYSYNDFSREIFNIQKSHNLAFRSIYT